MGILPAMYSNIPTPPLTVTFDRNVYEGILNPEKTGQPGDGAVLSAIARLIRNKQLLPFISESVFTLETIGKRTDERRSALVSNQKLKLTRKGANLSIGGDPVHHPGTSRHDVIYLKAAVDMGFMILPIFRFARLVNPDVKPEWRYHKPEEDPWAVPNKFSEVSKTIEAAGAGFGFVKSLLKVPDGIGQPWTYYATSYTGPIKKFDEAIAEWSDGDSVAAHLASGIAYFCTYDRAGNAGSKSVFGATVRQLLKEKYALEIVTPGELLSKFSVS